MAKAWETLERAATADGELELRRRGEDDFLITVGGRVLMNSHANRSEIALAELVCRELAATSSPRVLIGGLGMGCTLAAALSELPPAARVVCAELHPVIADWCAGPLADLNRHALSDPRVELVVDDVAQVIRRAAEAWTLFDAIALDLFEGPHARTDAKADPLYGSRALGRVARALAPGGLFAVWSEAPDASFERRLARAGFEVTRERPGRGGLRHAVHLGRLRKRS